MSKIISTNKLNRLWVNGIKPTVDKVKNTIKDRSDLMSNSEENKLVDALAIKEAINYYNVAKNTGKQYSTLEEFVEDTVNNINVPSVGRFKDIAGFVMGTPNWYRYMIVYQNTYQQGSSSSVSGNGIFWNDQKRMWNVFIHGNKDSGLTATYKEIGTPTIKTRQDLMANAVSGLFPDALAVKDAINEYRSCKYSSKSYATFDEFAVDLAGTNDEVNNTPFKSGTLKDTSGWGPRKSVGAWYHYMLITQNVYSEGQPYDTAIDGVISDGLGKFWTILITGKKDTGLTVTYTEIGGKPTISGQEVVTMMNGATTNQYTKISKSGNVVHLYLDMTLPANATAQTVYATFPYPPAAWYVTTARREDLTMATVQMGNRDGVGQLFFHSGLKAESTRYYIETTYICQ